MKKLFAAMLLSAVTITPALADGSLANDKSNTSKFSVGAGYGLGNGGVLSVRGDYDIADRVNNPVKVRVGFDHYSESYSSYKWSYNVFYGGAYYDFNKVLKIDAKIHPFAGLGLGFGSVSCSGGACGNGISSPTVGGLYYIGGIQYDVSNMLSAELNISGWTGLSIGANYNF